MNIAPARPVSRDVATGNDVGVLVRRFYRAAIPDPLLGPVFERFGVDWPLHLPRLAAYWEHVHMARPGLATNTVAAHGGRLNASLRSDRREINRWIELWEETVDGVCRSGRRPCEDTFSAGRPRVPLRAGSPSRSHPMSEPRPETLADVARSSAQRAFHVVRNSADSSGLVRRAVSCFRYVR